MQRVSEAELTRFSAQVLTSAGLPAAQAQLSAQALVYADLRGTDSHGVARLSTYVSSIGRGTINPAADIRIEQVAPASARIDGDNGIGLVVGSMAMDHAIATAKSQGVGIVAVRRSNHFGTGAFFAQSAIDAGCVGLAFSNAAATMAAWGGRDPILGTNPMAIGVPGGALPPFLLDMATSLVARGRFRIAQKNGEAIPEGWAVTPEGHPARTPQEALAGISLPFGEAKGSGLSMFVSIMAGVLAGAGFGHAVHHMNEPDAITSNIGHFFIAIDIAPLMPISEFTARFDSLMSDVKSGRPAVGVDEIFIPGERSGREIEVRRRQGIPIPAPMHKELDALAHKTGVSPLQTLVA